jgi:hypothetical protein
MFLLVIYLIETIPAPDDILIHTSHNLHNFR